MVADTIFALSSGAGAAGVAIIRISGPRAFDSVAKLCGALPRPRTAALRRLLDPRTHEEIDTGLVLLFPGPESFTGEDVAELQVHGSLAVIRRLLGVLGGQPGFRAAEAGEFTYRAFTHGKLELIEVEALGDLLAAETVAQARLAKTYQRRLHEAASKWRLQLIDALAFTEAHVDFSDEGDVAAEIDSPAEQEIAILIDDIEAALGTFARSERIRRGLRVVVAGPPNAGKSTLVNMIASRDVAITSPIPGTTRDLVEVHLDLGGYPVVLVDTAGIRDSSDTIEMIGVDRALEASRSSDLVLWLSPEAIGPSEAFSQVVHVRSQSDISEALESKSCGGACWLPVSGLTGAGIPELIEAIQGRAVAAMSGAEHVVVAHERQRSALSEALNALGRARRFGPDALELRSEELRLAVRSLDRLVGVIDHDVVLDRIFSRFCIGK